MTLWRFSWFGEVGPRRLVHHSRNDWSRSFEMSEGTCASIAGWNFFQNLSDAIDVTATPLHLGLGATARAVDGFAWDPDTLAAYAGRTAEDGAEGRLVMAYDSADDWTSWERHPAGEEVVICLSGRFRVIREIDGEEVPIEIGPGEAMINGVGVWHTADVLESGRYLTITPGQGTEHRPR